MLNSHHHCLHFWISYKGSSIRTFFFYGRVALQAWCLPLDQDLFLTNMIIHCSSLSGSKHTQRTSNFSIVNGSKHFCYWSCRSQLPTFNLLFDKKKGTTPLKDGSPKCNLDCYYISWNLLLLRLELITFATTKTEQPYSWSGSPSVTLIVTILGETFFSGWSWLLLLPPMPKSYSWGHYSHSRMTYDPMKDTISRIIPLSYFFQPLAL